MSGVASAPLAQAIVAERMSLPAEAGAVDLLSQLTPHRRAQYQSDSRLRAEPAPDGADPAPRPFFRASAAEWVAFVLRMNALGMVTFVTKPKAVCGAFAVAKGDGKLRAITDARPANWCFIEPDRVNLPSPDALARIRIPAGATAFAARTDVSDFYHALRTPQWMWPYFCLPPVEAAALPVAARPSGRALGPVYPALTTLPMGFSHAVLLAQEAHLQVLDALAELFPRENRIGDPLCVDMELRAGRVLHALVIDDLLLFGTDRERVATTQLRYLAEGRRRGYAYKPEKLVAPTDGPAPALGLEFDGSAGTLRLGAAKMQALVAATRSAVRKGEMRAVDLQSLLGRWVWCMLPARPALSIFSAVFALTKRMARGSVKLWPSVKRELEAAADIAPLLEANLRLADPPLILASDASSTGLGVVGVRRSALAAGAVAPPHASVPGQRSALAGSLPGAALVPLVASKWRWEEHINALELRAAHVAVRWALRSSRPGGARVSVWSDSAVVVYVMRKGRSCSSALNNLMRAVASDLLRWDVRVEAEWIASKENPADAPSRAL